jgi:trehalose-6-phosphatase
MDYDGLMAWAAYDVTPKRDVFVRLQELQDDPDAQLAIADGVLMRTEDNIVKGVFRAIATMGSEHLALSVEHAALLGRFDHVKMLLKELSIERAHLDESAAYIDTKDEAVAAALRALLKDSQ